eukprot:CAMPEP_0194051602 /NCGR_PEP_ID=MMETSP0009_2-20130614/41375_1 /TAXON_ID=210454 /ORGANISM="Grammatophora oceanica, Strain CCMP 410" /LENGTH=199 /DNA_ID=CAMNT_0038698767 /DNA_START=72 /DNA_END=673 /DNA_ORIENTATION=+
MAHDSKDVAAARVRPWSFSHQSSTLKGDNSINLPTHHHPADEEVIRFLEWGHFFCFATVYNSNVSGVSKLKHFDDLVDHQIIICLRAVLAKDTKRKKIFKLIVGRRQHHRRTSQEIWAKYVLISLAAAMRACLCGGSSIRYASDHGETPDTGVEELSVPTAREIVRRDTGQVLYHRATIVSHDIPSGLRFGANATMTNA